MSLFEKIGWTTWGDDSEAPTVSWRTLKFPDDTHVRVHGLNEVLADLYSEGRQANQKTAEGIIDRLEAQKNFIPLSDRTRKEYAYVLLKEYREYVAGRKDKTP